MGNAAAAVSRPVPVRQRCRRAEVTGRLSQGVRCVSEVVAAPGCADREQGEVEKLRAHLRRGPGEGQGLGSGAGAKAIVLTPNTEAQRARRTQRKAKEIKGEVAIVAVIVDESLITVTVPLFLFSSTCSVSPCRVEIHAVFKNGILRRVRWILG